MKDAHIFVFGNTGYIGSHLFQYYQSRGFKTFGSSRKQPSQSFYLDINDINLGFLDSYVSTPAIGFICMAMPNIALCEKEPALAFKTNVSNTLKLVHELTLRNIKPVIFSSDIIFDGEKDFYSDSDIPSPVNTYGFHKSYLEKLALKLNPNCLILRFSKTYTCSFKDSTFLHHIAKQLLESETFNAATDLKFNPISIEDALERIFLLIENNKKGIYNLSGIETTSWYEIATKIAKALSLSLELVKKASIDDFSDGAKRAKNLVVLPLRFKKEFPGYSISPLSQDIINLTNLYPTPIEVKP